jgi:tetratricopeptide (TPR) repeat protein
MESRRGGHTPRTIRRALEMLKAAERSLPEDMEVLLYLAEIYRSRDEYALAIPLYRRAIRLDQAQVTASVGLGGIMMERGELVEAIQLWQDALAKNSGLELVRTNMAMAQWKSGDRDGARRSLEKAVEMNPGFEVPLQLLERLPR